MKFFIFLYLVSNCVYADCLRNEVTFGIPLDCELSKKEKDTYLGGNCTKDDNNNTVCQIKLSTIKFDKYIGLSDIYTIFDENLKRITKIMARGEKIGSCLSSFQLIEGQLKLSGFVQDYHKNLFPDLIEIYSTKDGNKIIFDCYETKTEGVKMGNQNTIYNFHYIMVSKNYKY